MYFYKIRNRNFTKIAIQSSYRSTQKDIFSDTKRLIGNEYYCDYFLVYNYHIGKLFKRYFKGEPIQIGSFRSNFLKQRKRRKKLIFYIYQVLKVKQMMIFL